VTDGGSDRDELGGVGAEREGSLATRLLEPRRHRDLGPAHHPAPLTPLLVGEVLPAGPPAAGRDAGRERATEALVLGPLRPRAVLLELLALGVEREIDGEADADDAVGAERIGLLFHAIHRELARV